MKQSNIMAKELDYLFAGVWSKLLNKPTKYKGLGRPRKSDYALCEHPFDKKVTRSINY